LRGLRRTERGSTGSPTSQNAVNAKFAEYPFAEVR
jgi:hypothetical protein